MRKRFAEVLCGCGWERVSGSLAVRKTCFSVCFVQLLGSGVASLPGLGTRLHVCVLSQVAGLYSRLALISNVLVSLVVLPGGRDFTAPAGQYEKREKYEIPMPLAQDEGRAPVATTRATFTRRLATVAYTQPTPPTTG